jgi:hypothetical protein
MPGTNGHSFRTVQPELVPVQMEHLLKVADSVARDASGVWADVWGELKPHVTPEGIVLPPMDTGFIPECGWPEFLERLWLLKHYIDSISRICGNTH